MRIVVIGATGHIGSYLVPRLVGRGYDTVCVSRRQRQPYVADECWAIVEHAVIDRTVEEKRGQFGERIAALRPNVVIDLTCYTLDSAVQLSNALAGRVDHLIHCGTIRCTVPARKCPRLRMCHDGRSVTTDAARPASNGTCSMRRLWAAARDRASPWSPGRLRLAAD
jgi:nucleoside-diphosphate-sugar epimerase